jgi:hypothetical protein
LIPIKSDDAPHSNLNVYFGKGRENKKGLVKPRHWYEAELIVPKEITSKPSYPKAGYPEKRLITVYTDDGWKFKCKVSGENDKNFRSADDLKILGRWIKGRLENSGALKVGELVTPYVLEKYGRDKSELIALGNRMSGAKFWSSKLWYRILIIFKNDGRDRIRLFPLLKRLLMRDPELYKDFLFPRRVTGLLLGNVQSGKKAMFSALHGCAMKVSNFVLLPLTMFICTANTFKRH